MSESLSTELSYGEPLGNPAESDTLSIPNEREPIGTTEQLPDSSDSLSSFTVPESQIENRLSVVSAASLESRRRSRHQNGRHGHIHRDLAHMLSVSARDAKELRRGLNASFNKLDQSRERASHAEKLALDMLLRVREAEEERENAMREASAVREELGRYKALLESAHGEIRRGQRLLQDQEHLRDEAETAAARARDNARQLKQRRQIELAREQGRKMGYNEGIQAGQRIGYYDGQSPGDGAKVYFNESPRFREIFDESNYPLDNFDHPPLVQPNLSPPNDPGDQPLAPQAIHLPYTGSQAQYEEIPHNTSMPPPVPDTSPLRAALHPPSSDSSSTTTLPAAPIPLHGSSRGPPTMPTIPEVRSIEAASTSQRSRSLRDSPRMHGYIQPAPQAPAHNVVLPSVPHLQDPATSEPPPGIVGITPLIHRPSSPNDIVPSIVYPLQDHAAFEPPPGSVRVSPVLPQGIIPPSIVPPSQDRTAFESPPGSVGGPSAPAHPASARDAVLPSISPSLQDHAAFQPLHGSVGEVPSSPLSAHTQGPVYAMPFPRGGHDHFLNTNGAIVSEGIHSPTQERFTSAIEATSNQLQGHHANAPGNAPGILQGNFPSASEYAPSQLRERFPSTHSRTTSRSRAESMQLADELRNPEPLTRANSRPGGSTPKRDGPPKRRPIPQMPAPLAPQAAPNMSYGQAFQSSARHGRPPGFDYGMPSDTGIYANQDTTTDRHHSPPRVTPGLAERPIDSASTQRSDATPRLSYGGQRPVPSTVRDSRSQAAPIFIPNDPPTRQQAELQNRTPRVHVQIPPTAYFTPDPASQLANSPTVHDPMPPTDNYSPGAAPSSPNPNVSDSQMQSPPRYPPTLYNEPKLQQQSSRSADYREEQTASSPTLPVPSRNSRATMVPPSVVPSRRNSYATRQGIATDTPRTPTDALPIPPPSLSPHPSPAVFARQIPPPQGAVTSPTPRRPSSPTPLPRNSSPAPLLRASSPAPLPVRSPSMRSANIHRNASDVSLPGAPRSPYIHYNPNLEADIAVLANSSAEKLTTPTW